MRAQAEVHPGAWRIPRNDVWNPPDGVAEVGFEHHGRSKVRGLVIDLLGRVYGPRMLQTPRQEGYCLMGRVSVGGRSVRAFTSTRMFERDDRSLIDVAVLIVSPQPPFDTSLDLLEAVKC